MVPSEDCIYILYAKAGTTHSGACPLLQMFQKINFLRKDFFRVEPDAVAGNQVIPHTAAFSSEAALDSDAV